MIIVKVHAPKRCKGEYSFTGYQEFYEWMNKNFKRPKGLGATVLLVLAERGRYYDGSIDCSNDKPLGYQAKELAREIGFLKPRVGGDTRPILDKVHDYIEKLSEGH
jgi:hypothetical protein